MLAATIHSFINGHFQTYEIFIIRRSPFNIWTFFVDNPFSNEQNKNMIQTRQCQTLIALSFKFFSVQFFITIIIVCTAHPHSESIYSFKNSERFNLILSILNIFPSNLHITWSKYKSFKATNWINNIKCRNQKYLMFKIATEQNNGIGMKMDTFYKTFFFQ